MIPTTSKITSIRYGETASSVLPTEEPDREVIYLPVDWLKVWLRLTCSVYYFVVAKVERTP